jgi:hypothetical protein
MLALWCLGAAVGSMLVIGLPLRGLLARRQGLDEAAWLQIPLVGLAFSLCILQYLVYLDVPVRIGVFVLASAVAALWGLWLWRGPVWSSLRACPAAPFAVAAGVLLIQGTGLLVLGPQAYGGRAWTDRFNYTTMAECFRAEGISVSAETLEQRPWLLRVLLLKDLRIGQSVLQAYHAVLTNQDSVDLFMPTILLGGPLLALALYAAARTMGLGRFPAAVAAALGGLCPGVTTLMLECFQSHALAIPILLSLPTVLALYNARRDPAHLFTAALAGGCLVSIYTELLALLAVLIGFFFLHALTQAPRTVRHCAGFALLAAAPVLFNPWCLHSIVELASSGVMDRPFVLKEAYPWAYESVTLQAVWVGDFTVLQTNRTMQRLGMADALLIVAFGTLGLLALVWRGWRSKTCPGGWGLPLALLGLAMIPAVMLLKDRMHPYQFYKLLVTVSPLLALGAAAFIWLLVPRLQAWLARWPDVRGATLGAVWGVLLLCTAVAVGGSYKLSKVSSSCQPNFRSAQHLVQDPEFLSLRRCLARLHDQNLLYRAKPDGFQQFWIMYFGRRNRVWLAEPIHNDGVNVEQMVGGPPLVDLRTLPADALVLSPRNTMYLQPPRGLPAQQILWQSDNYVLWKPADRRWACVVHAASPDGADSTGLGLGLQPALLRLYAGEAGGVRLVLDVVAPGRPAGDKLALVAAPVGAASQRYDAEAGPLVLHLPARQGTNEVWLSFAEAPRPVAGAGPVRLVVREIQWEPDSGSAPASSRGP